jgi:hypothetical protein
VRLSKDEETKFFVVEKKLTTREIIEGSNRVLQVKKQSGSFDDDSATTSVAKNRRAQFMEDSMLPGGLSCRKEIGGGKTRAFPYLLYDGTETEPYQYLDEHWRVNHF